MADSNSFDSVQKSEWLDKIIVDLKGKSIEELNWTINDRITISPFKDASDLNGACAPIKKSDNNKWLSVEPIWISNDLLKDNAIIIDALAKGASALKFHIDRTINDNELAQLLEDIYFDIIHTEFHLSDQVNFTSFFELLETFLKQKGHNINDINLSFQIEDNQIDSKLISKHPQIKFIGIDGLKYYKGKDHVDTELAQILINTQRIIAQLNKKDIDIRSNQFHFSIALDDCYLLNIASIRALYKVLSLLFESYGHQGPYSIAITGIVAETAMVEDINYNRIKCSSAALSGIIAGIDKLQVYNKRLQSGEQDRFRRKIARNVNHILSLESYLDRVVDPAAGSYYIESLTETIAQRSWESFQHLWSKENKL